MKYGSLALVHLSQVRTKVFINVFHLFFLQRIKRDLVIIYSNNIAACCCSSQVKNWKKSEIKRLNIPLLELHVFFPVSLIDQLRQQHLGTAYQEVSTTCAMHYKMWYIYPHTANCTLKFTVKRWWFIYHFQIVNFVFLDKQRWLSNILGIFTLNFHKNHKRSSQLNLFIIIPTTFSATFWYDCRLCSTVNKGLQMEEKLRFQPFLHHVTQPIINFIPVTQVHEAATLPRQQGKVAITMCSLE